MIDTKRITEDFERTAKLLAGREVARAELETLRERLEQRPQLVRHVDERRARVNQASKEIGELLRDGRTEQAETRRMEVAAGKGELGKLERQLDDLDEQVRYTLLRIPNVPQEETPVGSDESANIVLSTHGPEADSYKDRGFRPHWEVAEELGIYDAKRAAKISGAMFGLLRGAGARLLRSLVAWGLDLNRGTYEEILPPHFVSSATLTATGHLPKFEEDAYKLRDDDLWAIPTGEVPLMSLHRDEILDVDELPRRYMAYTACFRREAGSAGKDTRGFQRLHEFHKVELVRLCPPEQVQAQFDELLADCRRPFDLLGLPYRLVDLCTGDLPFSAIRVWDIELYAPGVDRWLEVSSVGVFTDFQARRGNVRFRRPGKRPEFPFALNGSALATPRVWAAIIEHGQQPDGSVLVPEPLQKYMETDAIRP